ncbi:MAG: substrate-binding domain-containing protein [Lachnospiraceae bacterium]
MYKKSMGICLALTLLLSCVLSGCGGVQEADDKQQDGQESKVQIGMSFDSFVIERWQRDRDVFISTAKELGAEVNVQNANGDIEEQIAQIEYFIQKKMDVIVVVCIDSNALTDVVLKAKNAGIKVIAYDRLIKNAGVDLYISFDNKAVGTQMAEAIVGSGREVHNVLMIGGPFADNNVSMVEEGFKDVMKKNHINIIDSMHCDGWKPELGASYIYENMDKVNQADAIMCGNDDIATYVTRALAEKRLAGKIGLVGQDADLAACQRIVEGTQIMTVYKPVEKLAQKAAEYAMALANGEEIEADHQIYDGRQEIPYVALEPVSVDKSNMDRVIIGSGFHLKEDVYLNVRGQAEEETAAGEEQGGQTEETAAGETVEQQE